MNFNLILTPYTKINLKWVMDLKVKYKSISLFKKENLGDLKLVKKCLDLTPKAQSTKGIIDKLE